MQGYYSDQDIFIMDDGTILDSSAKTTTDYEVEQTVALRDFLAEREIPMLYVNEPTKYIDDAFFTNAFARETWSNRNMDKFLSRIRQPILTAFVTRSSAATLPVSFDAMNEIGVAKSLSSFSLPLGATVNMDGVCVHLPVFVILAANMFDLHLGAGQLLFLVISIMFASVGAGGVPGGSVFLLFMVLENMGLQTDQVAMIVALALGINPILDMFETCCNVTGDNVCTYIVAKKNGLIEHGK